MKNDFLVLRWDDIENALSDDELNTFYGLIGTVLEEAEEEKFLVINKKEPYIDRIEDVIKNSEDEKISRKELLERLEELSCLKDKDLAHAEVNELLLDYLNDRAVTKICERLVICE